jgi:mannosyl-oligosaccharide alpha-1,2-mannosidase
MFLAFEKHCRNEGGAYVGLKNVDVDNPPKDDKMETFWLAETLKYFLLLFSDDSALDLNTHVLNTEAHPLRVLPQG